MRARALIGLVLALAPAAAQARLVPQTESQLHLRGFVELRWHGRPGSCEAAALCGVRGVARWTAPEKATVEYQRFGGHLTVNQVQSDGQSTAITRVMRTEADGRIRTCIDAPGGFFPPGLQVTPGSPPQIGLGSFDDTLPLTSGRCAGPLEEDFRAALPTAAFHAGRIDLRARRSWTGGPFTGSVVSTLRIRASRPRPSKTSFTSEGGFDGANTLPSDVRRIVTIGVSYRITKATGGAAVSLAGVDDATCAQRDSCGATGQLDYTLTGLAGKRLIISGFRLAPGHRTYTRKDAERDLVSGGFFNLGGGLAFVPSIHHRVTEQVTLDGAAAPCTDTTTGNAPGLSADATGTDLLFSLSAQNLGGIDDQLRTRCPGPTGADVFAGRMLTGTLSRRALLEPSARVVLAPDAALFTAGGWTGRRTGGLTLELRRTRLAFRVTREDLNAR